MGERSNVRMLYDTGDEIFFYTHWGGEQLPYIVQEALAYNKRWNDPSYLSRIIFSRMIEDDILGFTGYGISPYIVDHDNYWSIITVDTENKRILFYSRNDPETNRYEWSFEEYIELRPEEIAEAYFILND